MSTPRDQAGWLRLVRGRMPPCWGLMAEGSGGSVWREGDVTAAVVPRAPDRSIFNSVFYEDGERLLASLERIAGVYADAGINAWTVWVPPGDTATAAGLERAGHALDGEPRLMGMALSGLQAPTPDPELRISEREDRVAMARMNEIAYGYPEGDFDAVGEAPMPGMRIYFATLDGEEVCTLAVWGHERDAVVIWVATLPEARGRGIAGRLLGHALADARDQGLETTTLQSSKLGAPVYTRLGYRDFGAAQIWERRAG
ncbi:MAG: GNAT family N-acetyltransferase [Actinobacteria bacterium]|nr:GNAT family N-acetyltransferase [Actinomycetota bacterium]